MTFTYVDPTTGDRDRVRFLIQDTDSAAPHMTDAEIAWLITESSDVYDAAATAADTLAAKYAGKSDYSKKVGDLSLQETFSNQATTFQTLAKTIRSNRLLKGAPTWVANAASLQSTADREVDTRNTDAFMGQMDNPRASGISEQ